jgi:hypothetical protein
VTAGIVDEDILKAEAEAGLTEEYFDARQKEVFFFIYLYNTYCLRTFLFNDLHLTANHHLFPESCSAVFKRNVEKC